MKKRILFLESKEYYEELGIISKFDLNKYNLEFDGNKNYKISNDEIKEYSYVISMLYHDILSNFMIIKSLQNNVQTILLSDGIIEWKNMFDNKFLKKRGLNLYNPIIHDTFVCVGEDEREFFNHLGYNAYTFLPKRVLNLGEKIPLSKKDKILITTSNTPYFNNEEKEILIYIIKNIMNEVTDYDIYFRIFDKELIKCLDIQPHRNIITGTFEESIQDFNMIITTPSSIILSAMYHDRSVAQLIYRDSPIFLQSGWQITGLTNIKELIESMKQRDKNRIDFQKYELSKYIKEDFNIDEINKKNMILNKKIDFIDLNLYNMINSKMNVNFMYLARKIYKKLKKQKFIKNLLINLKNKC